MAHHQRWFLNTQTLRNLVSYPYPRQWLKKSPRWPLLYPDANHANTNYWLVWNCRSIRNELKRSFVLNAASKYDVDNIFLHETFKIKEDKFYLQGCWIFSADSDTRRKGVAILVWTDLAVAITNLETGLSGRYVKLSIKNKQSIEIRTLSCFDLEPNVEQSELFIPENIIKLDVKAGDLNYHSSCLIKNGV